MATRNSPWDSPAVSKRNIETNHGSDPSGIISTMEQVQRTIRLASRRHLFVEGAAQVGLAVSIAGAGLILLLILGTNIFEWYWPALLLIAGLAVRRFPASAARADPVPDCSDNRSQACPQRFSFHRPIPFRTSAHWSRRRNPVPIEARRTNWRKPCVLIWRSRSRRIVSGRWPAALAAVSFGLVAVRYMVTNSLSLHPPLVSFQLTSVFERVERSLGKKKDDTRDLLAHDRDVTTRADSAGSQQPDKASLPPQAPGLENQGRKSGQRRSFSILEPGRKDRKTTAVMTRAGETLCRQKVNRGTKRPAKTFLVSAKTRRSDERTIRQGRQKLRRPHQPDEGRPLQPGRRRCSLTRTSRDKTDRRRTTRRHRKKPPASNRPRTTVRDQQGSQQQDGKGQQSDQNQSAEGQGQGQTAEKAESAQGQSSDQSPQKGADAHSGVGRQDGDKGIKDAEQLKAMGKLADLIGKRSAQLTGEMTVETSSGKQQLRTQYSQKLGRTHGFGRRDQSQRGSADLPALCARIHGRGPEGGQE